MAWWEQEAHHRLERDVVSSGHLMRVLGLGTDSIAQSWLVERVGRLQLEDVDLLLSGICSGYTVSCRSADVHPVGLLVGLGLGADRAVQRWSVDFTSASTWLVIGVL